MGVLGGLLPPPRPGGGSAAGAPAAPFVGSQLVIVRADGVALPAGVTAVARCGSGWWRGPRRFGPAPADSAVVRDVGADALALSALSRRPADEPGPLRVALLPSLSRGVDDEPDGGGGGPPRVASAGPRAVALDDETLAAAGALVVGPRSAGFGLGYSGGSCAERRSAAATGRARS